MNLPPLLLYPKPFVPFVYCFRLADCLHWRKKELRMNWTSGWTATFSVFRWFSYICWRFGQWSVRWCLTACIFKISFFVKSKSYSRQKDEENERLWICQFQGATRLFESYARNEWLVLFKQDLFFWSKYFAESNRRESNKFVWDLWLYGNFSLYGHCR